MPLSNARERISDRQSPIWTLGQRPVLPVLNSEGAPADLATDAAARAAFLASPAGYATRELADAAGVATRRMSAEACTAIAVCNFAVALNAILAASVVTEVAVATAAVAVAVAATYTYCVNYTSGCTVSAIGDVGTLADLV